MVSINIGIFNLIPVPAFDGVEFVLTVLEAIRRETIVQALVSCVTLAGLAYHGFVLMIAVTWTNRSFCGSFLWIIGGVLAVRRSKLSSFCFVKCQAMLKLSAMLLCWCGCYVREVSRRCLFLSATCQPCDWKSLKHHAPRIRKDWCCWMLAPALLECQNCGVNQVVMKPMVKIFLNLKNREQIRLYLVSPTPRTKPFAALLSVILLNLASNFPLQPLSNSAQYRGWKHA